jgi:acetyltransferase-like isoleucine patch superfamily enzyme
MNLKIKLQQLQVFFIKKASDKQKTRYLRGLGMRVGEKCHINTMAFSTEPYLVEIGNHVAIAAGTEFITHDGAIWCFREELKNADIFGKITIGNNVFIGNNCTLLPNTQIGDNCIIGAGSVVRGQFPENSVIVGNPAKVVMKMSIQKLLYLQNPGFLRTQNLSGSKKTTIIKEHFGVK